jgi:hypothetical protein
MDHRGRLVQVLTVSVAVVVGVASALFVIPRAADAQVCATQLAGFIGVCSASAAGGVAEFTIKQFRFRKTDGTFVTVATESKTFNVALATAGTDFATYITGKTLDPAVYDAVSPTINLSIRLQGNTSGGAGTCFTKSASPFAGPSAPAQIATFNLSIPPGTAGITSDGTSATIVDSSISGLPLKVEGGEEIKVRVSFGVTAAILFTFGAFGCTAADPGALDVSMTIFK